MATNFYNTPARTINSFNPDGSIDSSVEPRYIPEKRGLLYSLGNALTGITAPFLGDYQWAERQAAADLQRRQSDMEFQALLQKNFISKQNDIRQNENRQRIADLISSGGMAGYVTKPYLSGSGELSIGFEQDPEYRASIKAKGEALKAINQEVPTFNQTLSALDRMEEFIDKSPDYKPGFLEATSAKADVALKKYSNDPFVSKYKGFVDQSLSNLARKLGEKGVLTEQDVGRILNGLGRMDSPREVRKSLVNEIRQKMADNGIGLLEAAQMSKEDFSSKFPDTAKKLFRNNENQGNSSNSNWDTEKEKRYQELLKKRQGK